MFRIRARRTRHAAKRIQEGAAIKEIHARYFLSVGLACESPASGSPEWKAAFQVKFGSAAYRRAAWEEIASTVKAQVPAAVYEAMNAHFRGPALHFTTGFSLVEDRERMLAAIQKGVRASDRPKRRNNGR